MQVDDLKDAKRVSAEPTLRRNRAFFRVQPEDKVNKLNEAATKRFFAAPPSRAALPSTQYAPNDRQGTGNR
jgi:hypothetical protein